MAYQAPGAMAYQAPAGMAYPAPGAMAYAAPPGGPSRDPHISPQFTAPTKVRPSPSLLCTAPACLRCICPRLCVSAWAGQPHTAPSSATLALPHLVRHPTHPRIHCLSGPPLAQVIHLRNLPFDVTLEEIREFCAPWGTIVALKDKAGAACLLPSSCHPRPSGARLAGPGGPAALHAGQPGAAPAEAA